MAGECYVSVQGKAMSYETYMVLVLEASCPQLEFKRGPQNHRVVDSSVDVYYRPRDSAPRRHVRDGREAPQDVVPGALAVV